MALVRQTLPYNQQGKLPNGIVYRHYFDNKRGEWPQVLDLHSYSENTYLAYNFYIAKELKSI